MKNKLSQIFEIIWLITAVLCLVAGVHQTYIEGFSKSYILFIFSFIAILMYLMRKHRRKSINNKNIE